jgi:DNA-binding NarL/FixJ family response regulator
VTGLTSGRPRQGERPTSYWRIAIIEDHLLQRERTREILGAQPGLQVVGCFTSLPEFLRWQGNAERSQRPHLLVLDLQVDRGPDVDPEVVRALMNTGVRVLVLSAFASTALLRAMLKVGVSAFVGKRDSAETIVAATWAVLERRTWMTPEIAWILSNAPDQPSLSIQEERALVLYASGMTLNAVAEALGVKPATAKSYLDRVKAKYDAVNRPIRTKVDMRDVVNADGYALVDGDPAKAAFDSDA